MDLLEQVLEALDQPVREIYGAQSPMHWGTAIRYRDGGPDPLDAMSAYWSETGPHWHYVTHGLSEIDEKVSDNPHVSGWGIELTFRLLAPPELCAEATQPGPFNGVNAAAAAAPVWPLVLLNTLARYVFNHSRVFRPGDWTQLPKTFDPGQKIAAGCFVPDPQLPLTMTPHGKVLWLQFIGLVSPAELLAVQADDYQKALEKLRGTEGLAITNPDRAPLF
jgi:hypothetical protein